MKTARGLRVKGHTLVREGWPHFGDEQPTFQSGVEHVFDGGYGCGLCSCGVLSGVLESNAARKRWHAEHKLAVAKKKK